MNIKKWGLGILLIVAAVGYFAYERFFTSSNNSAPVVNNNQSQQTQTPTQEQQNTTSGAMLKDGSYEGGVADAFYGKVQVKAVVAGGKLTDIQMVQ